MTKIPSSTCHCRSISSNNFKMCCRFYTRVLAELDIHPLHEEKNALGFGRQSPGFWVRQQDQAQYQPSTVYFQALSQEAVFDFYAIAFEHGGFCLDPPETRHNGFSCQVRDPEGNFIHVVYQAEPSF